MKVTAKGEGRREGGKKKGKFNKKDRERVRITEKEGEGKQQRWSRGRKGNMKEYDIRLVRMMNKKKI